MPALFAKAKRARHQSILNTRLTIGAGSPAATPTSALRRRACAALYGMNGRPSASACWRRAPEFAVEETEIAGALRIGDARVEPADQFLGALFRLRSASGRQPR